MARKGEYVQGYAREPIGLRVFEKPETSNLVDWFSGKQMDCYNSRGQPWPWTIFFDPHLENLENFKGIPALQWSGGCWPVPEETVIDRGRWVITLDYLQDYPSDYQADYQRILASLEFFNPEPGTSEGTPLALPTPTATVCLDESAQPVHLPARQVPLEVRFKSEGDIWVWNEAASEAEQISDTGNAEFFSFSPEGDVIAFLGGGQTEIWSVNRDGSDLRLLVSGEQVQTLAGGPPDKDIVYTDSLYWQLQWVAGTQRVGFEILRALEGLGGCCESRGHWQVDVDSGAVLPWSPPDQPRPAAGLVSPDGGLIAIAGDKGLSIANAAGTILYPNVLTYQSFPAGPEFAPSYTPLLMWSQDSQSLIAIVLLEDLFSEVDAQGVDFGIWRVPAEGEPAEELGIITALPYSIHISPDQQYMAYLKRTRPTSNHFELHLAMADGSQDLVYAQGHTLEFLGWAPDGTRFVFDQHSTRAPQLGSVCGEAHPLLDPQVVPASNFNWVDSGRFLFVAGEELRLGEIGGGSLRIGPFREGYYEFNRDEAALGGME